MTVNLSGPGGGLGAKAVEESRVKARPKRADIMKRTSANCLDIILGCRKSTSVDATSHRQSKAVPDLRRALFGEIPIIFVKGFLTTCPLPIIHMFASLQPTEDLTAEKIQPAIML
jgi:hypothetical protein